MSNTIKKFGKYMIILALLGVIVFFGVTLLFPTPASTLAFDKTTEVINNENFETNYSATEKFISKYSTQYTQQQELENLDLLSHSSLTISTGIDILSLMRDELAFAKNSPVYNKKANELAKLEKELADILQNAVNYIESQFDPVYNQTSTPAKSTLNALITNLTRNNKAIVSKMASYIDATTTIFIDLETNFLTNPYSKKIVQILSVWVLEHNNFLNDGSYAENQAYNSSKALLNLSELNTFKSNMFNQSNFLSYNSNKIELDQLLNNLAKSNIKGLTSTISISDVNEFISSIENEEIRLSTQILKNFILGGRVI